ncbi:hypothetical protein LXL04_033823 [Taraxacum kok-saghyz]
MTVEREDMIPYGSVWCLRIRQDRGCHNVFFNINTIHIRESVAQLREKLEDIDDQFMKVADGTDADEDRLPQLRKTPNTELILEKKTRLTEQVTRGYKLLNNLISLCRMVAKELD